MYHDCSIVGNGCEFGLFTILDTEKPNVKHKTELLKITQITCYQKVQNPHTFIVARIKGKKEGRKN